jgi:hypothetical protein
MHDCPKHILMHDVLTLGWEGAPLDNQGAKDLSSIR